MSVCGRAWVRRDQGSSQAHHLTCVTASWIAIELLSALTFAAALSLPARCAFCWATQSKSSVAQPAEDGAALLRGLLPLLLLPDADCCCCLRGLPVVDPPTPPLEEAGAEEAGGRVSARGGVEGLGAEPPREDQALLPLASGLTGLAEPACPAPAVVPAGPPGAVAMGAYTLPAAEMELATCRGRDGTGCRGQSQAICCRLFRAPSKVGKKRGIMNEWQG